MVPVIAPLAGWMMFGWYGWKAFKFVFLTEHGGTKQQRRRARRAAKRAARRAARTNT